MGRTLANPPLLSTLAGIFGLLCDWGEMALTSNGLEVWAGEIVSNYAHQPVLSRRELEPLD